MKLCKSLTILLLIVLIIAGCRDDAYFSEETEIPINTGIIVDGNLNGLIINEANDPVSGVLIEVMGESTLTDENGFFRISDIAIDNNGSLVKISKEGYLPSYKFTYAQPGENSYIKHIIPAQGGGFYPSSTEIPISLNGGAEITIPKGSVTYLDGSAYTGMIHHKNRYFDPSDPNLASYMPGDLRGINESDQLVQLVTYGMIGIELESESGEPLQLSASQPATLKFPIPESFSVSDTIPMWYLNENTGYWIEEGYAIKQGNFMIAEVAHFSFWNCDDPFPLIELQGQLIDQNGNPLSNQGITITIDNLLTGVGHTNENGYFRGKVPQGLNLILNVNICGNQSNSKNLGSFNIDTDLREIEMASLNDIIISGQLVDCNQNGVQGYVSIKSESIFEIFTTDQDGSFRENLIVCNNNETGVLKGTSLDSGFSKDNIELNLNSNQDLGNIELCDPNALNEFIEYSLGGELVRINNPVVTIVDGTHVHAYGESDADIDQYIKVLYPINNSSEITYLEITGFSSSGSLILSRYEEENFDEFQPKVVNNIGDMTTAIINSHDISLEMNIRVSKEAQSGKVRGSAWYDSNRDGLKDDFEQPYDTPLYYGLRIDSNNPDRRNLCFGKHNDFQIDNGEIIINWLVPEYDFTIQYSSPFGNLEVTLDNQGDDTLDSDFEKLINTEIYSTRSFFINPGETIDNIGLGILSDMTCQITPRCCPVDGMYFHVKRGIPPFTVNLSIDGMPLPEETKDQEEFEIFTSTYGTYEVQITDSINNSCTRTYEHNEFLNRLSGRVWIDNGTIPNEIDQEDDIIAMNLKLYKDNGEVISETISDTFGRYSFKNFEGGTYRIKADLPAGYEFLPQGNANEENENHIDPITGFSYFRDIDGYDFDILHTINIGVREK